MPAIKKICLLPYHPHAILKETMMYQFPVKVEFEDIDNYGILHHPKVLYYFERARARFMIDSGMPVNNLDFFLVLRDVTIKYRDTMNMFDDLIIEVRTKNIQNASFVWDYRIVRGNKLMTICDIQMVAIDKTTKKLKTMPAEFIDLLHSIEIQ